MSGTLEIYRNNLRAGFCKALALEFPIIERLGGEQFFRGLALDYQNRSPSRSGDIHAIGKGFPTYLFERLRDTPHTYFADVAAIEWSVVQALAAAEAEPFDSESLAALSLDSAERLRVTLHPSVRLTRTHSPALAIWRAHIESNTPDLAHIDVNASGETVLTWRSGSGVRLVSLSDAEAALLAALLDDQPLGVAFDAAVGLVSSEAPTFDVAAALRTWTGSGVIVALSI